LWERILPPIADPANDLPGYFVFATGIKNGYL
jgi:hypothetical protein